MLAKTLYRQVFMHVALEKHVRPHRPIPGQPHGRCRRPLKLTACLLAGLLPLGISLAESERTTQVKPAAAGSEPAETDGRRTFRSALLFRPDTVFESRRRTVALQPDNQLESHSLGLPARDLPVRAGKVSFLEQYRKALEQESRRLVDRDPSLHWAHWIDDAEDPHRTSSREAQRVFDRAHERILSKMLEGLIDGTATLKAVSDYVDGIRLDVKKGGGVEVGSTLSEAERSNAHASFAFIVAGKPRIEMKTRLAGTIRTDVEIPITSVGFRTSMSQRLTNNLSGGIKLGMEEDDRWVSLALEYRF